MRILHIAPLVQQLGPAVPGGAEQIALALAQEQARLGLAVSMIAAAGSELPAGVRFIDLAIPGDVLVPVATGEQELHALSEEEVLRREAMVFAPVLDFLEQHGADFDVVHNHAFDCAALFLASAVPSVHTLHLPPLTERITRGFRTLAAHNRKRYYAVSHSLAACYEQAAGLSPPVIHNGICLDEIPFSAESEDEYLWVGRISPEKGLHTAIDVVCRTLGRKLRVFGRVYDAQYAARISPLMQEMLVEYLGHRPRSEVLAAMRRARALVLPIEWNEPFGMVIVEALACGTPVVACRRGAAPEIIVEGETGFLADTAAQLAHCLLAAEGIARSRCREDVSRRFSLPRMAAQYSAAYRSAISSR